MVAVQLGPVQETMLVTLWARAWDAQRKEPALGDQYAPNIVRKLDFDFARFEGSVGTRFGVSVRAAVLEREVRELVEETPDLLIVELGVGLSSRFDRIDNGKLSFIEVDLPDVMELRRHFFEEGPRRTMIAGSVLDTDWLDEVARQASGRDVVFVAEGVFPYFYEGDVRALLRRLSTRFPRAKLVFDSTSPVVVAQHQQLRTLKGTRARFSWGLQAPETLVEMAGTGSLLSSESLRAMLKRDQASLPLAMRLVFPMIDKLKPRMLDGYRVNVFSFDTARTHERMPLALPMDVTRPSLART